MRDAIEADATRLLSAASLLETAVVIETRFGESLRELDLLLSRAAIEVVAFDREQARQARLAYRAWGRAGIPLA